MKSSIVKSFMEKLNGLLSPKDDTHQFVIKKALLQAFFLLFVNLKENNSSPPIIIEKIKDPMLLTFYNKFKSEILNRFPFLDQFMLLEFTQEEIDYITKSNPDFQPIKDFLRKFIFSNDELIENDSVTPFIMSEIVESFYNSKNYGIVFTPKIISNFMIKNSLARLAKESKDISQIRILDPSCGSGEFLINSVFKLENLYKELFGGNNSGLIRSEIIKNNIFGVELVKEHVDITIIRLFFTVYSQKQDLKDLNFNIKVGNSLIGFNQRPKEKLNTFIEKEQKNYYNSYIESLSKEESEDKIKFMEHEARNYLNKQYYNKYKIEIGTNINQFIKDFTPFHWILEFGPILKKEKFDLIIGNPPYVRSRNINDIQRSIFSKAFSTSWRNYDLYILFVELAFNLISKDGMINYILPYSYLNQPYAVKSRELLLKKTTITDIVDISEIEIFDKANVKSCIVQAVKSVHKTKTNIFKLDGKSNINFVGELDLTKPEDSNYLIKFEMSSTNKDLIAKINHNSIKLKDIFYISKGVEVYERDSGNTKDEFIFNERRKENFYPYIESKHLKKFKINWANLYLDYQPERHCSGKFPELFENPKILLKRIIGKKGIMAVFDENKFYVENTIICLVPYHYINHSLKCNNASKQIKKIIGKPFPSMISNLSKEYDPKVVSGVLNSTILNFYYFVKFGDKLQIYNQAIEELPLPKNIKTIEIKILEIINSYNPSKDSDKINLITEKLDQELGSAFGLDEFEVNYIQNFIRKES